MQDVLAILIALAAAAFLARRFWQSVIKRRAGRGACSNCPSNSAGQPTGLVSIAAFTPPTTTSKREDFGN